MVIILIRMENVKNVMKHAKPVPILPVLCVIQIDNMQEEMGFIFIIVNVYLENSTIILNPYTVQIVRQQLLIQYLRIT